MRPRTRTSLRDSRTRNLISLNFSGKLTNWRALPSRFHLKLTSSAMARCPRNSSRSSSASRNCQSTCAANSARKMTAADQKEGATGQRPVARQALSQFGLEGNLQPELHLPRTSAGEHPRTQADPVGSVRDGVGGAVQRIWRTIQHAAERVVPRIEVGEIKQVEE